MTQEVKGMRGTCPACLKPCTAYIPRGGDASALAVKRHRCVAGKPSERGLVRAEDRRELRR